MTRYLSALIAAVTLSYHVSTVTAQGQTNQSSDPQCVTAFSVASQALFVCIKTHSPAQLKKDLEQSVQTMNCENEEGCQFLLGLLLTALNDWDNMSHAREVDGFLSDCLATFNRGISSLCQTVGSGSALYCSALAAAGSACTAVCSDCACKKIFAAPIKCMPAHYSALVRVRSTRCNAALQAAKACHEACGTDAACNKTCDAMEAQTLADCLGLSTKSNQSDKNSGRTRASSAVSTGVQSKEIQGKPRRSNLLDRHDLGPTFVSPDTSTPGGRTARGVASSKTKATTSSDGVSKLKGTTSTDAVSPALSGPTGGAGASAPQQIK